MDTASVYGERLKMETIEKNIISFSNTATQST